MKGFLYILSLSITAYFFSCSAIPKDFTYKYNGDNTGLNEKIDIEGYYTLQRECDSTFFTMFMFYSDGLFTIATTSKITPELVNCFRDGGKSPICKYPLWGTYTVNDDTIKTQVIRQEGVGMCIIFRDYKILNDKSIVNINEYINPENTKIGNMQNYPSFYTNPCPKKARFYPLENKRNKNECPYLKKKWFSN